MEGDGMIGVMLQGGFIKQLEAGFKISNKEKSINKDLLKSNIKFNICDDKECFNCRVTRWDNISPLFILKKIINKIVRKVK
jgi:hypothetical protein